VERVDLSQATPALDSTLNVLQATLASAPDPEFPEALVPVWQQLQRRDVQAWRALRDNSGAVYTLRWHEGWGPPVARRWNVPSGGQKTLVAERTTFSPSGSGSVVAGVFALWTLLSLLLWRWVR